MKLKHELQILKSASEMTAVARALVLSFGRGKGAALYWAQEGHWNYYKIPGQLTKLLDSEKSLDTEIQEVQ